MAILNRFAKFVVRPLPRMIPPESRSGLDYLVAGSFFAMACGLWRRNNRAALAALICGAAELGVNLLTDYPDGPKRDISLRARREIDLGLGTMIASMPEFLGFKKDRARALFHTEGAVITVISGLTQYPQEPRDRYHSMERRSAA